MLGKVVSFKILYTLHNQFVVYRHVNTSLHSQFHHLVSFHSIYEMLANKLCR